MDCYGDKHDHDDCNHDEYDTHDHDDYYTPDHDDYDTHDHDDYDDTHDREEHNYVVHIP